MQVTATGTVVIRLSDLVDGQEAVCFAALVKKSRGMTARNQPFLRCIFRDKRVQYESMLWHDHRLFQSAESWTEGNAYRLEVRGKHDLRYGMQVELLGIRPATEEDAADGYDFFDLVESSRYDPDRLMTVDPRPGRQVHSTSLTCANWWRQFCASTEPLSRGCRRLRRCTTPTRRACWSMSGA